MARTTMVINDVEIEGLIVEALSRTKIPVTAVDWTWVPQFEASQLVVVTPLYDSKGPRETYARIFAALQAAGVYKAAPIKEVFVMSPEDPLAKELTRQLKTNAEGSVHILKSNGNQRPSYSVVFTPYLGHGQGGPIPSVKLRGEVELRSFLEKRLTIQPDVVDEALGKLALKDSTSIFNVQVSHRRVKKLGLAA
jgi:hypothetical protein